MTETDSPTGYQFPFINLHIEALIIFLFAEIEVNEKTKLTKTFKKKKKNLCKCTIKIHNSNGSEKLSEAARNGSYSPFDLNPVGSSYLIVI